MYQLLRNTAVADLPDPDYQTLQAADPVPSDERAMLPETPPGGAQDMLGVRIRYFWADDEDGSRNTDANLGSIDITPVDVSTDGPGGDESFATGDLFAGMTRDQVILIPGQRTGTFAIRITNITVPAGATHLRMFWEPY